MPPKRKNKKRKLESVSTTAENSDAELLSQLPALIGEVDRRFRSSENLTFLSSQIFSLNKKIERTNNSIVNGKSSKRYLELSLRLDVLTKVANGKYHKGHFGDSMVPDPALYTLSKQIEHLSQNIEMLESYISKALAVSKASNEISVKREYLQRYLSQYPVMLNLKAVFRGTYNIARSPKKKQKAGKNGFFDKTGIDQSVPKSPENKI